MGLDVSAGVLPHRKPRRVGYTQVAIQSEQKYEGPLPWSHTSITLITNHFGHLPLWYSSYHLILHDCTISRKDVIVQG